MSHPRVDFHMVRMRKRLDRHFKGCFGVAEPFGPDGWVFLGRSGSHVIVSCSAGFEDGQEWVHASISHADRMPTYEDLTALHDSVFGNAPAYQCFVPATEHVNLHEFCLHLWGRADGTPTLPNFAPNGTI